MEFGPFAGCTVHCNRTAHRIYDIFCDRHPKAGSLSFMDTGIVFPYKRLKNFFLEFLRHPNSAVLHL